MIGIVLASGRVAFSREKILVDAGFAAIARQGRSPEKRFRFSSNCRHAACIQWKADRCSIADAIAAGGEQIKTMDEHPNLPDCPIRPNCRWYLQNGEKACHACPEVITDQSFETKGAMQSE